MNPATFLDFVAAVFVLRYFENIQKVGEPGTVEIFHYLGRSDHNRVFQVVYEHNLLNPRLKLLAVGGLDDIFSVPRLKPWVAS